MTSSKGTSKRIKELAHRVQKSSKEHGEAVRRKRSERRSRGGTPDFSVTKKTKSVVNTNTVKEWFRVAIARNYPGMTNPFDGVEWNTYGKEGAAAKRLLKKYDHSLLEKAVDYMCDNWDAIMERSNGVLSGLPGVVLLWSMRDWIIADAEIGKSVVVRKKKEAPVKKHMRGEYKEEYKTPDRWTGF